MVCSVGSNCIHETFLWLHVISAQYPKVMLGFLIRSAHHRKRFFLFCPGNEKNLVA